MNFRAGKDNFISSPRLEEGLFMIKGVVAKFGSSSIIFIVHKRKLYNMSRKSTLSPRELKCYQTVLGSIEDGEFFVQGLKPAKKFFSWFK
jgi:hypothetical protein